MSPTIDVTPAIIDSWADALDGPVALHLRQRLVPAGDPLSPLYPPTYADIGYVINRLADGRQIVDLDSIGSQANRMEPIFERSPCAELVPQITVKIAQGKDGSNAARLVPVFRFAHRIADAAVRSSRADSGAPTAFSEEIDRAFRAVQRDAGPLARLAPTSLVFGAWDSRGSQEKLPRLVRARITAEDVTVLRTAAQFNSVRRLLSEDVQAELKAEATKKNRVKLAVAGLEDAPSVFRDALAKEGLKKVAGDRVNPEMQVLGGVRVDGEIWQDVTINLVALRRLTMPDEPAAAELRRYVLGLCLVAATADQDLYLREGCQLRYHDQAAWTVLPRRGGPVPISGWQGGTPHAAVLVYAKAKAEAFQVAGPRTVTFDVSLAKKLLEKKTADEDSSSP